MDRQWGKGNVSLQDHIGYNKLRRVRWVKIKSLSSLDSVFYRIVKPQQAFTNVIRYQHYIDRVMFKVYQKKGFCHLTIDIKKIGDIESVEMLELMKKLQYFITDINTYFGYEEEVSSNSIRINVQSPGELEHFLAKGKSIATLAIVLGILSCGPGENLDVTPDVIEKCKVYVDDRELEIRTLQDSLTRMEVDLLELRQALEE